MSLDNIRTLDQKVHVQQVIAKLDELVKKNNDSPNPRLKQQIADLVAECQTEINGLDVEKLSENEKKSFAANLGWLQHVITSTQQ